LLLAALTLVAPTAVLAEGEYVYASANSTESETTFAVAANGAPDTTFYARLYAAETCEAAIAPENLLVEVGITTDEYGDAFSEETITPPVTVGWFVTAELAATPGGVTLATAAECSQVTLTGLYEPNLNNLFIEEPARDQLTLDYSAPEDAICDSALDETSVPDASDFVVSLDGSPVTIDSVEIPNDPCTYVVLLNLAAPLGSGLITVSYTPGASPIRNHAGQLAYEIQEYVPTERALATVVAGDSLTTDGEADGANPYDPIETTLTTSLVGGGEVSIFDHHGFGLAGPGPERYIGLQVNATAPAGTVAQPISMEFTIDSSQLQINSYPFEIPSDELFVYQGGARVLPCDAGLAASPDPCESARSTQADDLHITIRTTTAMNHPWLFAYDLAPSIIAIESDQLASYDRAILWVTEEIDLSSLPAPEDFTVTIDGAPTTATDVSLLLSGFRGAPVLSNYLGFVDGVTFLELGWATAAAPGAAIEITYTPGVDPLRDLDGNEVPATTTQLATIPFGSVPVVPLMDESTGPDHVLLVVAGPVADPLPPTSDFAISLNGEAPFAPTSVDLRYPHLGLSLVDLTLPVLVTPSDYLSVTYTSGATPLALEDGTLVGDQIDLYVEMNLSYDSPRATEPDPDGGEVVVSPPDSSNGATYATITFPEVTGGGVTTFESDIETTAPPIPTNFSVGDPAAYFEISTTASFTPPAEICIQYNAGAYEDENEVKLLHYEGGTWSDVTSSLDTANNTVCGLVNTFSPFAIVEETGDTGPDYTFTGFFAPVDNAPTLNMVSAGRSIPVKFSLGGDFGLDIFAEGFPGSVKVTCGSTSPIDTIETTTSTGSSGLSYNASSDEYTYMWKTDKDWKGTCRQLTLELADGDVVTALFKFGK